MALEFFRRRQKMVIIIMVVLMVAFLVPSGLSMLMQRDPMKVEVGRVRWSPVTRGDWMSAQGDLDILTSLGLGTNPYRYPPWPTEMSFFQLSRRNGDKGWLAYALLLSEAKHVGAMAGEGEVDAFFNQIGYGNPEDYKRFIGLLRSSGRDWTEGMVRQAVRHWLMINASAEEAQVDCPPSEAEVAVTYRDVREEIDLRVLRLKADDYIKDVSEPNQPAIEEQFQKYRNLFAGQNNQPGQFGFGYRQPGRARINYLLVRGDVIRRVTEPAFDLVMDYFNQNKSEFVKKVPFGPPAVPPATQPTKDMPMTFAQAKQQVIEKLREDVVRGKMDELVGQAETEARRLIQTGVKPELAYLDAMRAMTTSADKVLATKLPGMKMDNVSLEDAVTRLADAAKLKGICFPWGTQGNQTLLPTVKVTLGADEMTLAAALAELSKQAKWPALRWAMCTGFKGVLFSVKVGTDGIDFFPIQAADLPAKTFKQIAEDPVLGFAYANPAGGKTMAEVVLSAKELAPPGTKETPMVQVGSEGGRMYVMGEKPGRLIWRLLAAKSAYLPGALTDEPGLREQVVKDLTLQAAFRKAVQDANKIAKASEVLDLETIAGRRKSETFTTGLFPRRTLRLEWSNPPKLGLDSPELQAYFIPQAFALVPKYIETAPAKELPGIGVVPIPILGQVLVMQRIDYRPLVKPEYDDFGRLATARFLSYQYQQVLQGVWFTLPVIEKRTGYIDRGGSD